MSLLGGSVLAYSSRKGSMELCGNSVGALIGASSTTSTVFSYCLQLHTHLQAFVKPENIILNKINEKNGRDCVGVRLITEGMDITHLQAGHFFLVAMDTWH